MAFFEQRFDERISYGARGGPVWKTTKALSFSGHRSVNRDYQMPLHRYQVAQAVKSNADFELVRAFFYNVYGAFDGFRFKDWSDFEATQANSRLTVQDGSPTEWQLQRAYTVGARTFLRDITKPCASPAPVVYRTRAAVVSVASAVVSTTTGLASISGHVDGDTYTWVGEFDVPVAFADDMMEHEIVDDGGDDYLMRWPSIVLEEIRVAE
jgi:uncharacterized protein (TIGR02217 family)